MSHCRADIPNRCCHLTSRVARRALEGVQTANRRNLGSVPNRWLGGSVVRWLGSCANSQHETHASRPGNEGLVPQVPIPKCRIIPKGQANIMQFACAAAGSVPRFSEPIPIRLSACNGYDISMFKRCLAERAKRDHGRTSKKLCHGGHRVGHDCHSKLPQ